MGIDAIGERATAIGIKLDQALPNMAEQAANHRDSLRETLEIKLDDISARHVGAAKELREETSRSFRQLGAAVTFSRRSFCWELT